MSNTGKTTVIRRRALGKLNLALSVGPPAGDLHPIASWVQCIDLADDVEIVPGRRGLTIEWAADAPAPTPIDWSIDDDLAMRALRALEHATGRKLNAGINIRKRIPPRAGLGGGSADAGAVLAGVNEALGLGLPLERLREISHEIGSDIAFFLDETEVPRPAVVGGTGERVERLSPGNAGARQWHAVLVLPPFGCPTGAVYRALDDLGPGPLREDEIRQLAGEGLSPEAPLFNDLSEAAERVEPRLRDVRARCERALGRPIHMSGSGSTLFVIAAPEEASAMARDLEGAVLEAVVASVQVV